MFIKTADYESVVFCILNADIKKILIFSPRYKDYVMKS
jgi:hypothetical protein